MSSIEPSKFRIDRSQMYRRETPVERKTDAKSFSAKLNRARSDRNGGSLEYFVRDGKYFSKYQGEMSEVKPGTAEYGWVDAHRVMHSGGGFRIGGNVRGMEELSREQLADRLAWKETPEPTRYFESGDLYLVSDGSEIEQAGPSERDWIEAQDHECYYVADKPLTGEKVTELMHEWNIPTSLERVGLAVEPELPDITDEPVWDGWDGFER